MALPRVRIRTHSALARAAVAAAVLVAGLALTVSTVPEDRRPALLAGCDTQAILMLAGSDLPSCVHSDVAPPGVDVHEPVSTLELRQRPGAGPAAFEAAQDLGVPAVEVATNVATPDVPCDGDGSSGYRVQAMYVVEAGRTNRYADLLTSMRLWAAGTDDVVNRSAALTGGVRHLRFATEAGAGGTCVAKVLNVTVPNGSMTSFGATVSAVQALGYTDPTRKYLMWTDATVLCGVASMYTVDTDSQGNPNNGSYPQYARVDSGCWGLGNGSNQHSVEAHEILHTLGGVQNSAPRSTKVGHCFDEADTMCYADGGAYPMQAVCPSSNEYFFDCNNNDYFSTYPDPGSYLDTHWNTADSRFLIGGGDGSGGGTAGTPTVLGATISVNNPAIPGLSTQVSVAPALPSGRSVASVSWRAARTDCVFSTPTQLQSEVTCSATSSTATTVTVTLVDSTGATKAVSSPLTFTSGGARPVTLQLSVDNQAASPASVCAGVSFPVRLTVLDAASGRPVKGLAATLLKKTPTMTAPATAGGGATSITGAVSVSTTTTVTTAYSGRTTATPVWAAGTASVVSGVPAKCSTQLTAGADRTATYYADPVTVSGTLSRSVGGQTLPVGAATLSVRITSVVSGVTRLTVLGTTKTLADGTYRLVVKPTISGTLSVALAASAAFEAAATVAGSLAVTVPATDLTAAVDRTDVGYGNPVNVTGTLRRVAGTSITPLSGATVSVLVTAPGKAPVTVASGRTTTTGTFAVPVALKVSGTLSVKYAGVAGQPAALVTVGPVTAGTWSTQLTASSPVTSAAYGTAVALSGTLTRTYSGTTEGAKGVQVKVLFRADGALTSTAVASATTTTNGAFTARVYPKVSGQYTVVVSAVPGYANAASQPMSILVV